jgi:hypothetical protein
LATVWIHVQALKLAKRTAKAQYPECRVVQTHVGLHQNFEIKSEYGACFGVPRKVSSQLKFTAKDIIAY